MVTSTKNLQIFHQMSAFKGSFFNKQEKQGLAKLPI